MSYIGTTEIGKMFLRTTEIGKAYLGEDLVFDSAGGGVTPVLPYDAEIEYLQTTGTQYIDTGIVSGTNIVAEIKAILTQTSSDVQTFLCARTGNNISFSNLLSIKNVSTPYVQIGGGISSVDSSADPTVLHTYRTGLQNNSLFFETDGTTEGTRTISGSTSDLSLYLFARHTDSGVDRGIYSKLYYCKITKNGSLVRDFIPVRVGQTGYLYDRVSGELFGNSGTGEFVLGGDIIGNGAYSKLDYVQGITSALATNIIAKNSQWEFDLVCDTLTSSNEVIISSGPGYGGQFAAACGNGKWGLGTGAGFYTSVDVTTRSTIYIAYTSNGISMTIGNETVSRTGTNGHPDNLYLFAAKDNGFFTSGKIYSVKCTSGGSFDGIPAQRNSDNKKGIYDLANDVFYSLT